MKVYGFDYTHTKDFELPDVADGIEYGRKASAVNVPNKSGKIRSNIKSSEKKRALRRIVKRRERQDIKNKIKNGSMV